MATIRCARFPNLYPSRHDTREGFEPSTRQLTALDASEETVYRAWARLLKGYGADDEEITFRCNQGLAVVNISKSDIEYLELDESLDTSRDRDTGVFLGISVKLQRLALQLHYDPERREGRLMSHGHVPEAHLAQLEAELRNAILTISKDSSDNQRQEIDRRIPLSILNEHASKLPGPQLLHEMLPQNASANQHAIEFEETDGAIESLSYSDLIYRSAGLAVRICSALGVRDASTQPVVPILLPQSAQLYVAMLAILRTGSAFCPLPQDAPPERLRFIIQDLSASVVVTTSVLGEKLKHVPNVHMVTLDDEEGKEHDDEAELEHPVAFKVQPIHTAYIMYTSGSTGQPKGVPVSHLSSSQSLLAHDRHIPPFRRFLQFASPTFDVSIFEIFFTFFRRCTLVCCERSTLLSDLPSVMRRLNVDAAELTPTVAAGLLRQRDNVPSLKLLFTIGEMLTTPVVQEFGGDGTKESILWGMYGPTEAAIHCTLQPAFSSNLSVGILGFPLDTVSAFIITPQEEGEATLDVHILPVGHPGELAIGGLQLADGYLNRPEQTAKAFIDTNSHGRLYRTGDRARILPGGLIECLGRLSSGQVKLRGQRIELGEIQYAATRTLDCLDAVATVIGSTLVVFCLAGEGVTEDAILSTCQQWLPTFMVPGDVVLLADFPRLLSGKVDRNELEKDYKSRRESFGDPGGEKLNEGVQQINNVLERILGHSVNPKLNLAASGLDSLTAIQAASALRRTGLAVTPMELLDATSVQALASKKAKSQNTTASSTRNVDDLVELRSLALENNILLQLQPDIAYITACTPLQVSMLVETAKEPAAYCNWVELQLSSKWDVIDIKNWLQILADKNEILRSGFCQINSLKDPFALVTWKELHNNQIQAVPHLSRSFALHTETDYFRPINFQIQQETKFTTLLVQIHHSLYDGWTLDLLLKDLDDLILQRSLEKRPQFSLVANFYWSLNNSSSQQYWQDQLHKFRPVAIPNYNGCSVENSAIEHERIQFKASLDQVRSWASTFGVGPQTIYQAALAYLLSAYLGSADVMFGTVTSGRTVPIEGIEEIMGPCVSTLPLRINVSHSKRVSDLVTNIHTLNRRMLEHGNESLQSIKHSCGLTTAEKLWDFLFVWQETLETRSNRDRSVKLVDSSDRLECALTIEIQPRGSDVSGKATYHSSILPNDQASLLLRQLDSLVYHIVTSADLLLDEIHICFPESVLSIENPQPENLNFDHGITTAVENNAQTKAEDLAITFAASTEDQPESVEALTYRQLNDRSNRLARLLLDHIDKTTELVCICMDKSMDLYVTILAVFKAGKGYLPITPSTPRERIKTILKEASVSVCFSQSFISTSLALRAFCDVVDVDKADISGLSGENLNIPYVGLAAAYTVFTSGSTGIPKGVVVTQHNLLSNLEVLSEIYPVSKGDRLLQACSQAFDVSVFEIFFAWYTGMCLCSASNDVLFNDIEKSIQRLGITHLSLTPTVAALVNPDNVPKVKFLVTAGEAVTEKVMRAWADKGLYQGYGPSETTNICTVKPRVSSLDLINNIGPPLRNTSAFVLNPATNDILPRGAVGELCFGGDQVFRGYLNKPDLTGAVIIDHTKYGRLYRSGDTGRLLANGSITFSGRTDDQVKIRGQRVELGEINRCILHRNDIFDCVTLALDDQRTKSARLVTFWVSNPQQSNFSVLEISGNAEITSTIKSTLQDLASTLPHYMIPTALIPITTIPMTVQGKVDKRKLTSIYHSLAIDFIDACGTSAGGAKELGEWSGLEQSIAQALSHSLDVPIEDLERHSSFFSIGLDSVSAMYLSKHLRDVCKQQVLVSTILQNPSIARLALQLQRKSSIAPPKSINDIKRIFKHKVTSSIHTYASEARLGVSSILPCTPLQEAMLSAGFSSNMQGLYCNTMLFKVRKNFEHMKHCWNLMVQRHEILRTYFVSTDDAVFPFAQVILSQHKPKWMLSHAANLEAMVKCAKDAVRSDLPPAVDHLQPPYLFNQIVIGKSSYLQFSCHHALHDGSATKNLLREVEQLLRGEYLPKPITFGPFLKEMVRQRSSEATSFWYEHLKDFNPSLFKSAGCQHRMLSLTLNITLRDLERPCRELSISPLSALQAAWAKTLQFMLEQPDVCFGNVVSGRTLPIDGIDRLVAPTFNTIPIRVNMEHTKSNLDLLQNLQSNNVNSLPFQLTPLRSIQTVLGFGGSGIFSTLLLFQQEHLELDLSIWNLEREFGEIDVPVVLELIPHRANNTLLLQLHYEESVLSSTQSQETLQVFSRALKSCIQFPASNTTDFAGFSNETTNEIRSMIYRPDALTSNDSAHEKHNFSAVERELFEIISELAHVPTGPLSPKTTIHQIGIDSIVAIQLASKLRHVKQINISAADILEKPSIADIAKMIEQRVDVEEESFAFDFEDFENLHKASICHELTISLDTVEHVLPCTPLQMGLISQFIRSETLYVNYVTYEVDASWSCEELHNAWESMGKTHVMLRTGFVPLKHPTFSFAMITYSIDNWVAPVVILQQTNASSQGIDYWRQQCTRKFHEDMAQPPWSVLIVNTGSKTFMHLAMFHGLYDAHSLNEILDDLADSRIFKETVPARVEPTLSHILGASLFITNKKEVQRQTRYWKNLFSNSSINRFPNLNPLRTSNGSTEVQSRTASQSLCQLERLSSEAGVSLQAAGQAAWAQLLSAYIGEKNVTFGVVLSGRDSSPDAERAVFPCLITVPVSTTVSQKNQPLLDAMMKYNSSVRRHQFTPMKDIQRLVQRPNEALFDTIFAFQKSLRATSPRPWKVVDEVATSEYVISLELEPQGEGLVIRATFLSDVIPKEQARVLLNQYDALLTNILSLPYDHCYEGLDRKGNLFSITPPRESTLPSPVRLLHHFVEANARALPERTAFEFASEFVGQKVSSKSWSYRQLDEEGNRIANLLIKHGAVSGDLIAICFDKCPEASFGILGILKAGCAYVALDPGAPSIRKSFIIGDSKARLLLTSNRNVKRFTDTDIKITILYLDECAGDNLSRSPPTNSKEPNPQSVCYCLYTSGTTGTPKGCEITHENAVQAMRAFSRLFSGRWDENSKWLQFASFHFDVSVLEQYWSWSEGIRVVSAPRDLIFEDLARTVQILGITHIDLTPSLASLLHPDDVPSLCQGVFITGGEQLKQEILDVWGPMECIHNGYGPTEATIGVTMYTRVPKNGKPANIGPQFDNVSSYVLQPGTTTAVLRGAIGELCVGGKLVGKGYLNRPDLTKEKFPYVHDFKERIYRTGDLVRILHDGSFLFLGRADDQVKLRGQRLELSEIDTIIKRSMSNIKDISTLVLKHPKQQREQLVTFIVIEDSPHHKESQSALLQNDATNSAIQQAKEVCLAHLPGYMVPTHFIPLTKIPLSANNKTEGKVLKQLFYRLSPDNLHSLSARNAGETRLSDSERKVAKELRKYVQVEEASLSSSASIFELGLDSITVIGFARALKAVGFKNAQASTVMKLGTIKALARGLASDVSKSHDEGAVLAAKQMIAACSHHHRSRVTEALRVAPDRIEAIAPCTPLQQGMISKTTESDNNIYLASFRYRLEAGIQLDQLKYAWTKAVKQFQILRTRFVQTDEGHVQVVLLNADLPWSHISVEKEEDMHIVLDEQRDLWREKNQSVIVAPYEIAVVESPSQLVLSLHIFHGLYDGNSLPMMLALIQQLYRGDPKVEFGPAFHEVLPYGPLLATKGVKAFWTGRISGKRDEISQYETRSKENTSRVARTFTNLPELNSIRKRLNVTHQAVVQACWAATLQQHYSRTASLGVVSSGRSIDFDGAERVIGPMFNTIPFQIEVRSSDTWKSIAKKCHEFNVSALPFQHTPLRDIQKWCKVGRNQYLFNNLFVFQRQTADIVASGKNELWTQLEDETPADFPLAFDAELQVDGSLQITLVAQSQVADLEMLESLVNKFEHAIRALINRPHGKIADDIGEIKGSDSAQRPRAEHLIEDCSINDQSTFQWTKEALAIKQEIVKLAVVDDIDVTADVSVFELGLDSIDAIKLSSRLGRLGITIPVSSIMRKPSISMMIDIISTTQAAAKKNTPSILDDYEKKLKSHLNEAGIVTSDLESVLPATPLQEAMVAEMLASGFARYYNHDVLKLSPTTDLEMLWTSWQLVYRSSPILRTKLTSISDTSLDCSFAQIVSPPKELDWVERHYLDEAEVYASLSEISRSAATTNNGSTLFKLTIGITPTERFLIISLPHALYDGYSINLLHNDVSSAYTNLVVQIRPSNRSVLEDIIKASTSEARQFWSSYLYQAEPCLFLELSVNQEKNEPTVHRNEQVSNMSVEKLRSFCKNQGITMQALGQACWSLVLASYVHKLEVVYGVVLSGRDTEESQQVIFPTMNTIAFRSFLHGTGSEMVRYTHENISNIRQFQHFPLRKAQAFAKTDGEKLFNSLFIYQIRPDQDGKSVPPLYESVGGASAVEFPVCVEMEIIEQQLIWRVACSSHVFDPHGTLELLDRLEDIIQTLLDNTDNDVVSSTGNQISVATLPPFEAHAQTSDSHTAHRHSPGNGEEPILSPTEKKIRDILSVVSMVPETDIQQHSTLFHLGLDSISAIKVSALLRKQLINISVSDMLRASTVEGIAHFVDQHYAKPDRADETEVSTQSPTFSMELNKLMQESALGDIGLREADIELIIPATAGQVYMLSTWQNSNGQLFLNEFPLLCSSNLRYEDILTAWNRFLNRYSILRSIFVATEQPASPFVQAILKIDKHNTTKRSKVKFSGSPISISAFDSTRTAVRELKTFSQPFATLSVTRSLDGLWQLGLKIHHALYDGVSITLLLDNLRTLIENPAASDISVSSTPWKILASDSYATRQSNMAKEFWTSYLSDVTSPSEKQISWLDIKSQRFARYVPSLIPDAKPLLLLAQQNGISLPNLFLAIYARLYQSLQGIEPGTEDTIIGIYIANRSSHSLEGGLETFPTVNLVPLRVNTTLPILTSANEIQADIARISEEQNVSTGLWQIHDWTGIKVGTFVNWLRVPDSSVNGKADSTSVLDAGDNGAAGEEKDEIIEAEAGEFVVPKELEQNYSVREAYLPSIDIEVALRAGGLDVGIFGPTALMRKELVEDLMSNLRDELMKISKTR